MSFYLIKSKKYYWFFDAPDDEKAKILSIEILSNENTIFQASKKISFFHPTAGYCEATGMTLGEAQNVLKEREVKLIVPKEQKEKILK